MGTGSTRVSAPAANFWKTLGEHQVVVGAGGEAASQGEPSSIIGPSISWTATGGGHGGDWTVDGGNGGKGIVIIRYVIVPPAPGTLFLLR
ncbi:MAG: hypothetical protein O2923_09145 [Verrucomicrobia bacterium]|nr:hypothetical protein [Verrucomicrobiota bacterium]MDA1088173.1 hypothetical protein [Verrucomicrobiota bacterium]